MGIPIFKINGAEVDAPRNWQDIEVLATFDRASVQANISTTEFSFVNKAARIIIDHIEGGYSGLTNGIFEALNVEVSVSEDAAFGLPTQTVFKGVIDTARTQIIAPNEVNTFFIDKRGIDKLESKSEGLTFGLLKDKNWITDSDFIDIPYVFQRPNDFLAQAMLSFAIYELYKQAENLIKEAAKAAADIASGITGTIVFGAKLVILGAYFILLVFQLSNLLKDLKDYILPDLKYYKGMRFKTMLEKGLSFMGYTLQSSIPELETYYYMPTKRRIGQSNPLFSSAVDDGIPSISDSGYIFSEFLEIVLTMFYAKIQIDDNNVVNIEALNNDAFWIQQSSFQLPDVLRESYEFNTDELKSTALVDFASDYNDEWSLIDYTGTVYEIKTSMQSVQSDQQDLLSGLRTNSIPLALGSRKDSFTFLETVFSTTLGLLDDMVSAISFLPGTGTASSASFSTNFNKRLAALRISEQFTSLPKVLNLAGISSSLQIPTNHRDNLSAKALWEKYMNKQSFVDNNFGGQYKIYKNIKVPFALNDFISLKENSYFYDTDGARAKVDKISWKIGDDYAVIDYRKEFIYTKNLQETKIEGDV
jgi:hypothetical protein